VLKRPIVNISTGGYTLNSLNTLHYTQLIKPNFMKAKIVLIGMFSLLVWSCGDDDEAAYKCKDCVNTPEALAANDASGKGIYKGLVIGSSGTLKINMANNGSTIDAVLVLDDETIELTTEATYDVANGFDGHFFNTAEEIEIGFYVSGDGSEAYVYYMDIPGHPDAIIEVAKEKSNALVKVFEGEYTGSASGAFNMLVQNSEWEVVTNDGFYFYGSIASSGEISCDDGDCQSIDVTGTIKGDIAKGSWESNFDSEKGSWDTKRTL
jgi:uncharacterized protein with FMN-binding domain